MSSDATAVSARTTRVPGRSKFFCGMSAALLLIVIAGFAPTLYLRPLFDVPPIPAYLYVHGIILTLWFVWLFGQSYLVAVGRTNVHRRLGVFGALTAAVVVITSLMAQFEKAPRLRAIGLNMEARLGMDSGLFWNNIGSLLIFSVFVTTAILMRYRPAVHKRLMLIASAVMLSPAFGRIARWPIFGGDDINAYVMFQSYFAIGGITFCLLALVIYDLASSKRIHPVTLIGCAAFAVTRIVAYLVSLSEFGRSFVREMD
jgi:hypothetical protein